MERERGESADPVHRDLVRGLRGLGDRAADAREAAGFAMRGEGLSLEERMRAALTWFRPRGTTLAGAVSP